MADYRCDLYIDAQQARASGPGEGGAEVLRLGVQERRPNGRVARLCPDAAKCGLDIRRQLEADRRTRREAGVGRALILTSRVGGPRLPLSVVDDLGDASWRLRRQSLGA